MADEQIPTPGDAVEIEDPLAKAAPLGGSNDPLAKAAPLEDSKKSESSVPDMRKPDKTFGQKLEEQAEAVLKETQSLPVALPIEEQRKAFAEQSASVKKAKEAERMKEYNLWRKENSPIRHISIPKTSTKYHIGTMPGSPIQNITLGGVSFPRMTEEIKLSRNASPASTQRNPQPGEIIELSPSQVDRILEGASCKVVRMRGTSGKIYSSKSATFKAHPHDIPIEKFIYMRMAPENVTWREDVLSYT